MNQKNCMVRFLLTFVLLASATGRAGPVDEGTDRHCGGEPCAAVVRGLFAFFGRNLHGLDGNGRSCDDCHMVTERFRVTPAAAETRYQSLRKRHRYNPNHDDPIFRAIDADDFRCSQKR